MRELVENLDYEFTVLRQINLTDTHPLLGLKRPNVVFLSVDIPTIGLKRDVKLLRLRKKINKYSIFHCLSSYLPTFNMRIPSIVTVHDLKYLLFPDFFNDQLKSLYYNWIIRRGMHKATHIIAVSFSTRNDIIKNGISPEKVTVIYEAPTIPFFKTSDDLPTRMFDKPYLIFIGENRPHKNVSRLIEAHKRVLNNLGATCPILVVVGSGFEKIMAGHKDNKVMFYGSVSEKELVGLYRNAVVLVYPSLYEGFGLPIIEAMSLGTPVITSDISSMPEVAGNAALLINPYDVNQIADAIVRISTDHTLRERLISLGQKRIRMFSWTNIANSVIEIYKKVLK